MYLSGETLTSHFADLRDPTEQAQPAGLDLTLDEVYIRNGTGEIRRDGKTVADRIHLTPTDGAYMLEPGAYIVKYTETISIPENHVGFVYPRSTLLRNGCTLHTAVWDPGYTGKGEGLLEVNPGIVSGTNDVDGILLEEGARIGQIVVAPANADGEYTGTYDGEGL